MKSSEQLIKSTSNALLSKCTLQEYLERKVSLEKMELMEVREVLVMMLLKRLAVVIRYVTKSGILL